MKKLLFLLFAIALLSSCEPMAKEPKAICTIPTEVYQSLKTDTVPTTMYVYEYDDWNYYFNKEKEVITAHYTGSGLNNEDVIIILLCVIIMTLLVGIVIGAHIK